MAIVCFQSILNLDTDTQCRLFLRSAVLMCTAHFSTLVEISWGSKLVTHSLHVFAVGCGDGEKQRVEDAGVSGGQ